MTWNAEEVGVENWNESTGTAAANEWNDDSVNIFDQNASNGGLDSEKPAGGSDSRPGACFSCGQEGHIKADCTAPGKENRSCRECGQEGHIARDCPQKPKLCRQCGSEGDHDTIDCKNAKLIDNSNIPDMSEKDAWKLLGEADDDLEIADFKEAVKILSKAKPDMTYVDLERSLRKRNFTIHLIALEKECGPQFTITNLQGMTGQKYTLGFYKSAGCTRPVLQPMWPKGKDDNLERLEDVGVPLDRGVPMCSNCNELGHIKRNCTQELNVHEGVKVSCALCGEDGHRVRDCTQERQKPRAPRECRFCQSAEHIAKDCDQKPKLECRNCFEEGHISKECTNERVMKCSNCETIGHGWKDCPAPKDWTKVRCRTCGDYGHASASRCTKPPLVKDDGNAEAGGEGESTVSAGGNGFGAGAVAGSDSWAKGGDSTAQADWEIAHVPISAGAGDAQW